MIVGGTPAGRGVVAAANHVVRKFGVHSAMPTATALRLCPDALVLPPRLDDYAQVSEQTRDIFFRYTPLVEPLSLDKAFLDVTGSDSLFGPAVEISRQIKQVIRREVGLVASVGIAPNKFLANDRQRSVEAGCAGVDRINGTDKGRVRQISSQPRMHL